MTGPFRSDSDPIARHGLLLLLLLLAGLVGNGCLSKPALKQQTFAFQNPPLATTTSATGGVVAVHPISVSPLFNRPSFVYRTGPEAYETDAYAGFLVAPSKAIDIAVRAHLLSSGRFQNVVEPGGPLSARKAVEIHVSELYGDFSQSGRPAAVLTLQVSFFDVSDTKRRPLLWQKNYSRRVPLQRPTAAAVMGGWDGALDEIMTEVSNDLAGGVTPPA
jgi:hypothetical protein